MVIQILKREVRVYPDHIDTECGPLAARGGPSAPVNFFARPKTADLLGAGEEVRIVAKGTALRHYHGTSAHRHFDS
jgi:hypothetical protein